MGRKMFEETVGVGKHLPRKAEESTPAPIEPETSTRIAVAEDLPPPLGEGRGLDLLRKREPVTVLAPDVDLMVEMVPEGADPRPTADAPKKRGGRR